MISDYSYSFLELGTSEAWTNFIFAFTGKEEDGEIAGSNENAS